MLPEARN